MEGLERRESRGVSAGTPPRVRALCFAGIGSCRSAFPVANPRGAAVSGRPPKPNKPQAPTSRFFLLLAACAGMVGDGRIPHTDHRPPLPSGLWPLASAGLWPLASGLWLARMVPIGPGGLQSGFSTLRYVRRDFRKNKSGPRTPRPPPVAPRSWVLGSLVRRAEGLPSTRNWPFRWPLSPTSPPQVIPKAM
jgi:hypothetical protein